jgi:hypothetical protein
MPLEKPWRFFSSLGISLDEAVLARAKFRLTLDRMIGRQVLELLAGQTRQIPRFRFLGVSQKVRSLRRCTIVRITAARLPVRIRTRVPYAVSLIDYCGLSIQAANGSMKAELSRTAQMALRHLG